MYYYIWKEVCYSGDIEKVYELINDKDIYKDFYLGLYGACEGGHLNIVKLLIDKCSKKLTSALFNVACTNGNIDIVKLLIERDNGLIQSLALDCACESGNIDLVNLLLKYNLNIRYNRYSKLFFACKSGNIDLIEFIIGSNLKEFKTQSWDEGLQGACRGGHLDAVKFIIKKSNIQFCWKNALNYACAGGNLEIVKLVLQNIDNEILDIDDDILYSACYGGNIDVVNLIIELSIENATDYYWDFGFEGACDGGHSEIAKLIIEKGTDIDYNECLNNAVYHDNIYLCKLILEKGANNIDDCIVYISGTRFHYDTLTILLKYGGNIYLLSDDERIYYTKYIVKKIAKRTVEKQKIYLINMNDDLINNLSKYF